ncbi:NAD(P)/FAD-dependent oxidoreductase, partial [Rhizobium sp. CFBP 13717]
MPKYDAVVIGAGHNGLAAAVHLASKGWRVVVVEGNLEAGGAVKTGEVTEPGFRHDLCAMNLSMFAGSAFHATHGDALARHGLRFVPADHCFASVFPDNTYLGVGTDRVETTNAIASLSQSDARQWSAMIEDFGQKAPHLFALLGSPMPSVQSAKAVWKAWRAGGFPMLYDLARLLLASPRSFLDSNFENDKLKAMMAAWGLHLDFAPDVSGGAVFPYLESMANQVFGMVIGEGGADTIIKSMISLLKEKGGDVLLSAPVEKVLLEGGKAKGVILADGRILKASRAVISNVHPKLLFGSMVPPDPARTGFDEA